MIDSKETIRTSISDLIDLPEQINSEDNELVFNREPSTLTSNAKRSVEKCKEKGKKIMDSLLRLYVSEGYISKSEYLNARVNLDASTLGTIIHQMEVSEEAINMLMEEINIGELNPKLFDSLGSLQRTLMELIKTQAAYISTAEETYKKISLEKNAEVHEVIEDRVSPKTEEKKSTGVKSNNPKDLMRMIRDEMNEG